MTEITGSSVIVASNHVTSAQVEEERVVLDLEEGVYYGLNPVGTRVWELIQEPRSIHDIVSVLATEFEVSKTTCKEDVESLIEDLEAEGLVEVDPERDN